ncbi:hypothetical protein Scep_023395 [Stephania cephalantha]|uniref:DUF7866 domain-containing protein n=1 Tax=Stephania cephalantha TaxID=152367 RepID=A0AAP0EXC7_9MAGN
MEKIEGCWDEGRKWGLDGRSDHHDEMMFGKSSSISVDEMKWVPQVGPNEYSKTLVGTNGEAKKKCAQCNCCSGSTCKQMDCCYQIKCNLPGKPFGYCAFLPIACNCNSCPA